MLPVKEDAIELKEHISRAIWMHAQMPQTN
jgi:hypothetical protein